MRKLTKSFIITEFQEIVFAEASNRQNVLVARRPKKTDKKKNVLSSVLILSYLVMTFEEIYKT